MRIIVARRLGKRGEGLGTEIVTCAKGFIASHVLSAKLIGPSWSLNRRKYYRNFRTSRLDILAEELLTRLPHYDFLESDYLQTGEIDFGSALRVWAAQQGLNANSSFIVTIKGMYGGYPAIRHARPFLWNKLLGSRDALGKVYDIMSSLDPGKLFVAVHMRLGHDFETLQDGEDPRGRFNLHVPGRWYLNACETLKQAFGDKIHFHFFTDRRGPAFEEAVRRFNPQQRMQSGLTECSDIMVMAQADLRICSVSAYSLMASFLGGGPYIWYEPQLIYEGGAYTLWGNDAAQRAPGSLTMESLAVTGGFRPSDRVEDLFSGWPMGEQSALPYGLVTQLQQRLRVKGTACNLLEFGSVPDWVVHA